MSLRISLMAKIPTLYHNWLRSLNWEKVNYLIYLEGKEALKDIHLPKCRDPFVDLLWNIFCYCFQMDLSNKKLGFKEKLWLNYVLLVTLNTFKFWYLTKKEELHPWSHLETKVGVHQTTNDVCAASSQSHKNIYPLNWKLVQVIFLLFFFIWKHISHPGWNLQIIFFYKISYIDISLSCYDLK